MEFSDSKFDPLEHYYQTIYSDAQKSGIQGFGGRLADMSLLGELKKHPSGKVLELGAGSGEFTNKAIEGLVYDNYVASDLRPRRANAKLAAEVEEKAKQKGSFEFAELDAQRIPYSDGTFDLVFSTCLLAHVVSPSKVINESLRVTKAGGAVVFLMPTDPGVLNQLVKRLITYPKLRKLGVRSPDYIYALEHRNPVHNLIAKIQFLAKDQLTYLKYRPLQIPSWNLNL